MKPLILLLLVACTLIACVPIGGPEGSNPFGHKESSWGQILISVAIAFFICFVIGFIMHLSEENTMTRNNFLLTHVPVDKRAKFIDTIIKKRALVIHLKLHAKLFYEKEPAHEQLSKLADKGLEVSLVKPYFGYTEPYVRIYLNPNIPSPLDVQNFQDALLALQEIVRANQYKLVLEEAYADVHEPKKMIRELAAKLC